MFPPWFAKNQTSQVCSNTVEYKTGATFVGTVRDFENIVSSRKAAIFRRGLMVLAKPPPSLSAQTAFVFLAHLRLEWS